MDVGGGHGVPLDALLAAVPRLQGVLLDHPSVVAHARARLASAGPAMHAQHRRHLRGGPPSGDAYVLSRVIHDWDGEVSVRILTYCRRASGPDGTFLLVEVVLPTRANKRPGGIRVGWHMSGRRVSHLPSSTRSRPEEHPSGDALRRGC